MEDTIQMEMDKGRINSWSFFFDTNWKKIILADIIMVNEIIHADTKMVNKFLEVEVLVVV